MKKWSLIISVFFSFIEFVVSKNMKNNTQQTSMKTCHSRWTILSHIIFSSNMFKIPIVVWKDNHIAFRWDVYIYIYICIYIYIYILSAYNPSDVTTFVAYFLVQTGRPRQWGQEEVPELPDWGNEGAPADPADPTDPETKGTGGTQRCRCGNFRCNYIYIYIYLSIHQSIYLSIYYIYIIYIYYIYIISILYLYHIYLSICLSKI